MPFDPKGHAKWKRTKQKRNKEEADRQLSQPIWEETIASALKVAETEYPKESAENAWARDPASKKTPDPKEVQKREIEDKLNDWPWEGLPSKLLTKVCTLWQYGLDLLIDIIRPLIRSTINMSSARMK
jgi:hypothetical protein